MTAKVAVILVLFSLSLSNVSSGKIPDYVKICHRSDPEMNKCIINSIESMREQLKGGIPELGVPPLEPLVVPVMKISEGQNGFMAVGKDVKIHGAGDFKINKLKLDRPSDNRVIINVALTFPRLEFEGDFDVNAQIANLPVKGNGPIRADATETKADVVLTAQIYKKGNHNYIRYNKIDMGLKIEDFNIRLGNLFGNNKVINEAINQALNENKQEFLQSANPVITRTASELILEAANKIAKNNPYEELFPQ